MPETSTFISREKAQAPFFVGIDLGGTNIKAGVVDDLGRPLSWLTIPTESDKGPEDAARRMGQAALEAIRKAGLTPAAVARVGLGSPGAMDIGAGVLVTMANFKGWDKFPLRDRVQAHCRLPVTLVNDANAAAYGEFWVGSGRDFHSMVFFTLGTGIGCGIIIGDLLIDGENGCGAECGHMIIDCSDRARPCPCGQLGHLEAYASATAVVKRTNEALRGATQFAAAPDCPTTRADAQGLGRGGRSGRRALAGSHRRNRPAFGRGHCEPHAHR